MHKLVLAALVLLALSFVDARTKEEVAETDKLSDVKSLLHDIILSRHRRDVKGLGNLASYFNVKGHSNGDDSRFVARTKTAHEKPKAQHIPPAWVKKSERGKRSLSDILEESRRLEEKPILRKRRFSFHDLKGEFTRGKSDRSKGLEQRGHKVLHNKVPPAKNPGAGHLLIKDTSTFEQNKAAPNNHAILKGLIVHNAAEDHEEKVDKKHDVAMKRKRRSKPLLAVPLEEEEIEPMVPFQRARILKETTAKPEWNGRHHPEEEIFRVPEEVQNKLSYKGH